MSEAARIFKQLGTGYGSSPVSIVATIDGNTVFSGTVPTVDGAVHGFIPLDSNVHVECFSWTEASGNFVGAKSFSVTVSDGPFQLGQTTAQIFAGNLEAFGSFNVSHEVGDPLTNTQIDGFPVTRGETPPGQWNWTVPAGSTFTATLNIGEPIYYVGNLEVGNLEVGNV